MLCQMGDKSRSFWAARAPTFFLVESSAHLAEKTPLYYFQSQVEGQCAFEITDEFLFCPNYIDVDIVKADKMDHKIKNAQNFKLQL